ncbi:MAG TPA: ice-binding family protein [Sediminibacterium sp.]|uniref:ice-binding family protein n=1 Tax=Sediminibacterium sp. TaxID=1917865 RepID=UPI002B4B5E1E|nr:ice-binding family protein [Sediminibacterium sp.]HLD54615.1 ice-binding family protein [Sediminibacterium sp.]
MKVSNKISTIALAVALTFSLSGAVEVNAATVVNLGSADSFAVLAASTITNTGASTINGNLGLSPGTSVTGFPPGIMNGVQNIANANAISAQTDLIAAYGSAGQTPASTVSAELGGTVKNAGVYVSNDGSFGITGTLTLDAQGDPNAIFIFKSATTLTTAGLSVVNLLNGAQACNVFWQVGSSATLGINSNFKGNILALTSATLTTGATVDGRVLVRNGAVTLDSNTITKATCMVTPTPVPATPPAPTSTPTPTSSPTPTPLTVSVPTTTPTPVPTIISTPVVTVETAPIVASETVVVPTPKMPASGIAPAETISPWNIVALVSLFVTLASYFVARRKTNNI